MNVSLTPHLDAFVRTKVETGRYTSSSEVVREALRLLEQLDAVQDAKLAALRDDVQLAIDQVERGETAAFDPEAIKREGRARRAALQSGDDA
ncbi:type II toxin-antitoxin system ParD family antitoxin [Rubrivirga sp. S365]|uniref:type II toxin-antitoxin system ParD family antitoxin n=1 Tax=Rubrivirga sp. S365 TaxID=3076080 RepID=UPI0028CAA7CC|nr:type II toxin-antitoxin system ParD family antitoxin [Rubrivirga sp. S365]MDT7858308.1 type II toxin-antitoxin system ParD family antitoxin [Rubrivirga sp. S365]